MGESRRRGPSPTGPTGAVGLGSSSRPLPPLQTVKGILGLVDFHGSRIPIGFIISFKKSGHNHCNGQGFALLNGIAHACVCAWGRAERNMRKIGRTAFEGESIKYASETQEKMYQDELRERARQMSLSQVPVSTERHVQNDFEVGGFMMEPSMESENLSAIRDLHSRGLSREMGSVMVVPDMEDRLSAIERLSPMDDVILLKDKL